MSSNIFKGLNVSKPSFSNKISFLSLSSHNEEERLLLDFLSYLTSISDSELFDDFENLRLLIFDPKNEVLHSRIAKAFIPFKFRIYCDKYMNDFARAEVIQFVEKYRCSEEEGYWMRKYISNGSKALADMYCFLEKYFSQWFGFFFGLLKNPPPFFYLSLHKSIMEKCLNEKHFVGYLDCGGYENSFLAIDCYIDYVVDSYFTFSPNNDKILVETDRYIFEEMNAKPFYESGFLTSKTRDEIKEYLVPFFKNYKPTREF